MYLNLVQIAESFGVSEKVIEDWIRREGLPHVPERGRLLFDSTQVVHWAVARGLTAQVGFLANTNPAFATGWRLEPMLRTGGIWRNVAATDVLPTFERIVTALTDASPAVKKLVAQRMRAPSGITMAPVGGGFALPHPSARVTLGRDSGLVALLLLREPLQLPEPPLDDAPITRLLFFIAPSPRAHLDLLGRLSRILSRGVLRDLLARDATNEEIFLAIGDVDAAAPSGATAEARS